MSDLTVALFLLKTDNGNINGAKSLIEMTNRNISDRFRSEIKKMEITEATIAQYKTILGLETLPLAWSEKDLDRLGVRSIHSLRRDRLVGGGIPFFKAKGSVKYPTLLVLAYLHNNLKTSTSNPAVAQAKSEE